MMRKDETMGAGAMGHMETSLFEQCGYSREAI